MPPNVAIGNADLFSWSEWGPQPRWLLLAQSLPVSYWASKVAKVSSSPGSLKGKFCKLRKSGGASSGFGVLDTLCLSLRTVLKDGKFSFYTKVDQQSRVVWHVGTLALTQQTHW